MKKSTLVAMAAMLLVGVASCSKSDPGDLITKATLNMYCFVEDGLGTSSPGKAFTQAPTKFEINFGDATIKSDVTCMLRDGSTTTFQTEAMKMKSGTATWDFSSSMLLGQFDIYKGQYDMNVGLIAHEFSSATVSVHAVSAFYYVYNKMVVSCEGTPVFTYDMSEFLLEPTAPGSTLKLTLGNFKLLENDRAAKLTFKDVPYALNTAGNGIDVDAAEVKNAEGYVGSDIKNLKIRVSSYGKGAVISFDMDKYHVDATCTLFSSL
ncbi:MAG: hypothetical protein HUK11_07330 [Muribaculaceae bacterium]|nr:hypothetical protein [Muribaculaceae bacterium]